MEWGWRPVVHSIHLFLLIAIISMATCCRLWLHKPAYASPPSPILWFICVSYVLFAIIVFPVADYTLQLLRINRLANSLLWRAIFLFTHSISLATLIAAAALEPPTVSATAPLAHFAIQNFFASATMISSFSTVALVDNAHRWIPRQNEVDHLVFDIPVLALLFAIYPVVIGVRLAAASHAVVATEPVADIACAVLAVCSVLFSMFSAGFLPLPSRRGGGPLRLRRSGRTRSRYRINRICFTPLVSSNIGLLVVITVYLFIFWIWIL
ncbi:uncharacterized protein DS421_18g602580 [Arachis hypogaea]|nr:uncharacterized protein DS421_18g602580 [Arachis hypogaea]